MHFSVSAMGIRLKATHRRKGITISLGSIHCNNIVQVRCRIQEAWGWCTEMTQRDGMGREVGGGFRMGTRVHPWRMHVDV